MSSRSGYLPQSGGGRRTRTAQKAAKPITPLKSPPTHPGCASAQQRSDVEPDPQQLPTLPTISQLRDFPNLTAPNLHTLSPVITTLPKSAPSSPISVPQSYLDIEEGDPITPVASPSQVSVILSNPNLLQPPPPLPPRSSTPIASSAQSSQPGGSWDNYLENPTYQQLDQEFWRSRRGHIRH